MAKDIIDELEIRVTAEASKANNQIDGLKNKLETLSSSLKTLENVNVSGFANSLTTLSQSLQSMKSIRSDSIGHVAKNVERLGKINPGNMNEVSSSMNTLSHSLTSMQGVNFEQLSGISTFSKSISKLGNMGVQRAAAEIPQLAAGMEKLTISMHALNLVNFDNLWKVTEFAKAMGKLGGVKVTQATTQLPQLAKGLESLIPILNSLPSVPGDFTNIANFATAIATLGKAKISQAMANLPKLTTELVNTMRTLSRAPTVSASVIRMTNALANLANKGAKVGVAARSMSKGLTYFSRETKTAESRTMSITRAIGLFYARFWILIRALKSLGTAVKSAMNYIEEFNYFSVVLQKIGQENKENYKQMGYDDAESYANSFQARLGELNEKFTGYTANKDGTLTSTGDKNLGLNITQMMNYEAQIAQVTNSVGMMGETSLNTAKALAMLSADMSSLRNVDLSMAMNNFSSGLIGQSKALYKYGIDITNTNLARYAAINGIKKEVSEMSQQEKMQLRVLAILDQSKVAYGDLARRDSAA